jgi:hypothetical protein
MQPPCPHCDQPDLTLLRLVLIGEIFRADETLLLRLADVMQQGSLLPLADTAEEPAPIQGGPARARCMCSGGEVREPSPASIR